MQGLWTEISQHVRGIGKESMQGICYIWNQAVNNQCHTAKWSSTHTSMGLSQMNGSTWAPLAFYIVTSTTVQVKVVSKFQCTQHKSLSRWLDNFKVRTIYSLHCCINVIITEQTTIVHHRYPVTFGFIVLRSIKTQFDNIWYILHLCNWATC